MSRGKSSPRPKWSRSELARSALSNWRAYENGSMRLITVGENATWRISSSRGLAALRIYRPGRWSDEEILTEHRLMNLLGEDFAVSPPLRGKDGETLQVLGPDRSRAALFPWAKGRLFLRRPSMKKIRALGSYIARMHRRLESLPIPRAARYWDENTLLDGALEILRDKSRFLPESELTLTWLEELVGYLRETWRRYSPPLALIHADLHFGNIKWSKESLTPIDFDDAGVAPLSYDLGVLAFYCKGARDHHLLWEELLRAYGTGFHRSLSMGELKLFVAVRTFWLLAWVCDRSDVIEPGELRGSVNRFLADLRAEFKEREH